MLKIVFGIGILLGTNSLVSASALEDLGQHAKGLVSVESKLPALIIGPGAKMNIGGKVGGQVVSVFGDDQCPADWMDNMGGVVPKTGCIVLNKPHVTVHFNRTNEEWTVKKVGDRISLIRPNGIVVASPE